jgi:dienelactone hydrolase
VDVATQKPAMTSPIPDFSQRGPYAVGALETKIPSPGDPMDSARSLPTEIWYPAVAPPPASDPTLTAASHPLGFHHEASIGLAPDSHTAQLIAFSHGNSGFRQQSTFLTTHLASWGFVVVAPDHVGNTFNEMMALTTEDERKAVHLRARSQRPHDLVAAIRGVIDDGFERDRLPPIDPSAVGILGHSYGGWTSLKIPAMETRVRAIGCLAPVSEPFVGRKAFEAQELPFSDAIDTLILTGRDDVLVDLDTSIRPLHERLGPAARLEIIDGADHFHFCDGIELLHKMHENNPRPNQLRATRPLNQLLGEVEMHALVNERVTRFFGQTLGRIES